MEEREKQPQRGRTRDRGERKIVARQVTCYNPLSCFNPVTTDKVGKKKIERETGWEKDITRGDRII